MHRKNARQTRTSIAVELPDLNSERILSPLHEAAAGEYMYTLTRKWLLKHPHHMRDGIIQRFIANGTLQHTVIASDNLEIGGVDYDKNLRNNG